MASREPLLRVSVSLDGDNAVLRLDGELDVASHSVLADALLEIEQQTLRHLVIDAERLTFVDAAGLHPLLSAKARMPATRIELRNVRPQILRVLRLLDLADAFDVDP
ncbi:MAG TPA: STAS domain-containing protein [Mycobacteriales bacterium]|nr:STAS domain-containing protein [Mycobacteriales bacterium]